MTFPRSQIESNADQQVLDIAIHRHPISHDIEEMEDKIIRSFAKQDPGKLYENWPAKTSICRSDWQRSKRFLIEQGFGWIVFYKSRVHDEITPQNYTCLMQMLGAPDHDDPILSGWNINSH